jgi:hypothetical protein
MAKKELVTSKLEAVNEPDSARELREVTMQRQWTPSAQQNAARRAAGPGRTVQAWPREDRRADHEGVR